MDEENRKKKGYFSWARISYRNASFILIFILVLLVGFMLAPKPTKDYKKAKFDSYEYYYGEEDGKLTVLFMGKHLPANNQVLADALKSVIKQIYNEETVGSLPYINLNRANETRINTVKNSYTVNITTIDNEIFSFTLCCKRTEK